MGIANYVILELFIFDFILNECYPHVIGYLQICVNQSMTVIT